MIASSHDKETGFSISDRVVHVDGISVSLLRPLPSIAYDLDDTVNTERLGEPDTSNPEATNYTYTNRDWPALIEMKKSGTTKLSLAYTYDDVGNVKTIGSETYTYDWLDRLKSASGGSLPSGLTYNYDAVGNRISKGSTTYTHGSYNKLTGDGTWSYTYDPNGKEAWKTKSSEKWNYQWNSLDQLTKVVKGTYASGIWTWTTIGEYSYDANGARAKTVESGTTIEYVFLGHNPMCEKSGTTYTDYVYVNGKMMAKQTGSDIYYYIKDALGSTRQVWKHGVTSATFSVATYAPFGTPVTPSGTEKFKYAGEMLVGAAGSSPGLYYIGARWMDPELGRFVSFDSQLGKLSMPQSMNRYVYCVNNPLRFVDPTGQDFVSWLKGLFFSEDYRYEPFDQEYHPGEPLGSWNPPWENKGWQLSMAVVGIAFGAEVGLTYLAPYLPGIAAGLARLGKGGKAPVPPVPLAEKASPALGKWLPKLAPQVTKVPVQTTLERYGLQFTESPRAAFFARMDAMAKSESVYQTAYARSILQIGPEWKLAGGVLAGAATERVGHMLFERIGTYVSQRSASMPTFG